jgi:hypothetical protein
MRNLFKYILSDFRSRLDKRKSEKTREQERAATVDEAIDHLVDGIDPNIRLVVGYKKKLWNAVDKALIYIAWLVDTIPGPVECNRKSFTTNPLVNAVFATADDIEKTFNQSEAVTAFLKDAMNVNLDEFYALMCMEKNEHSGFGLELEGDVVKKDVPQISVNFFAHNIMAPAATEKEVRECLKKCIFDALISNTFETVMAKRLRDAGTDEYRKVLDRRYKANQAWGQELTDLIMSIRADANSTKATSSDTETQQAKDDSGDNLLESPVDRLNRVLEILAHPENMVRLNHISMNLTLMGILVKEGSSQASNKIGFTEIEINNVWRRTILLVRYPRSEMKSKENLF